MCWRWRMNVRRCSPDSFIVVGGHSAAAYPSPFFTRSIDAVCVDDGEIVLPALADALDRRHPVSRVPGLLLKGNDGEFKRTAAADRTFALDEVPLPLRRDVDAWRRQYACLLFRPVWLIETARGCPFRCSFCSVWPVHDRAVRLRSIESVCADFEADGPSRVRRRRSLLVSARAQPRTRQSAEATWHSKTVAARAEPNRSRGEPSRTARSLAPAGTGLRHLLRARGGHQRRA